MKLKNRPFKQLIGFYTIYNQILHQQLPGPKRGRRQVQRRRERHQLKKVHFQFQVSFRFSFQQFWSRRKRYSFRLNLIFPSR